ncbi:MAG TPA: SRPBCC domain-containing protein [Gemmatimonadales bacterium]|nr:SRPBCC domain-containing protein [Gemmatimonadales bacterium]
MKWALIAFAAVAILVALTALAGVLVSRDHRATSTISLRQPPDTVWKIVRDIGGVPSWFPAMQQSQRLPDRDGHEVWRQKMSGFDVPIIVLEASPPRRLVTQIDPTAGGAFGGTWTYDLTPDGNGTRISVTEAGWIGNPVFRFMSRFIFGYYGSLDGYLKALGKRFGETAQPMHS